MTKQTFIKKTYHGLFYTFFAVIPFEEYFSIVPNILLGGLILLHLFMVKKELLKMLFLSPIFITFCILFIIIIASTVVRGVVSEDFFILKKLIIPIIIVSLSLPIIDLNRLKLTFSLATVLAVLYSGLRLIKYVIVSGGFEFSKGGFINEILVSERLYLGFCCVLAYIFLIELFYKSGKKNIKILSFIGAILIASFLFLITARIAIISMTLITVILILKKQSTKGILLSGSIMTIIVLSFFILNKNLGRRFFKNTDLHRTSLFEKIMVHEPRFDIWKCSYSIFKSGNEQVIFGHGFRNFKEKLVDCYEKIIRIDRRREWFMQRGFNSHNQFIDFGLSSGVLGLFLFILLIFFLFKESKRDLFLAFLVITLTLMCTVENIFHRQLGNYLFSMIFILVLVPNIKREQITLEKGL